MKNHVLIVSLLGVMATFEANASLNVLVVQSDSFTPQARLQALGVFGSVDVFDAYYGTPTLSQLASYDAVLAYSDSQFANPGALGNVLADYVDAGGKVVLATYGYSSPWSIGGRITTHGYAPLINQGVNGDVSGQLVAVNSADTIFNGIDLSQVSYFHNWNFAHPGLDNGASLLATDGNGIDMIARSANGQVVGLNLFPGDIYGYNNPEFYKLLGNTLDSFAPVPEPSTYLAGLLLFLPFAAKRLSSIRNRNQ